jgi:hypothetical protein
MRKPRLTVLLASHNGALVLPRTLEGYRYAEAPPVGWKMVVVDSGSTDSTPDILRSFADDLPLESLYEPVPGKNRALNAGLEVVEGDLVILTDDDAIPAPSFLVAWSAYLESHRDFELFGGSIEPLFDSSAPRWLINMRREFAMMFAERALPEGATAADQIYGPNMAVRSSVFQRGFRFNEEVGPNALDPNYPMGGETEFCWKVVQSGASCWFAKAPLVKHIVRPEQLTLKSWASRAYRCGRGRAHQIWERGQVIRPPRASLLERLSMLSPLLRHRFKGSSAYYLEKGFRDEWRRREFERQARRKTGRP